MSTVPLIVFFSGIFEFVSEEVDIKEEPLSSHTESYEVGNMLYIILLLFIIGPCRIVLLPNNWPDIWYPTGYYVYIFCIFFFWVFFPVLKKIVQKKFHETWKKMTMISFRRFWAVKINVNIFFWVFLHFFF